MYTTIIKDVNGSIHKYYTEAEPTINDGLIIVYNRGKGNILFFNIDNIIFLKVVHNEEDPNVDN